MPRYQAVIPSRWSADQAFGYMADFSNAADWDPGVARAAAVARPGTGGLVFDLVVRSAGRELPLRYHVVQRAERQITFRAETPLFESVDRITVAPAAGGSTVEYDARLNLRGWTRLFNPVLGPVFHRIAERARRSLAQRLAGTSP